LALIGARDCELRALEILDRVFLDPDHPDTRYAARRADIFVVAVTCGTPSDTCWCTSMGAGPQPRERFDLRVTELPADDGQPHRLVVDVGTIRGRQIVEQLPAAPAPDGDAARAQAVATKAAAAMPARLPGAELPRLLAGAELHAHWDTVAERCLSCGNCTLVCPTCFCNTFSDHTPLGTDDAVRRQSWSTCFELEHSNLGGRPVRATIAARYRQWLLHKLQTWPAQFGTQGCVGCGRCTTWCPAGIDLVEEARILAGVGGES
jgi:ferredoxin